MPATRIMNSFSNSKIHHSVYFTVKRKILVLYLVGLILGDITSHVVNASVT